MVFRGLYHFSQAILRGDASNAVPFSRNFVSAVPLQFGYFLNWKSLNSFSIKDLFSGRFN